jgi:hypothetical protein
VIAGVRGKELDDARSLGVSDVLAIDDDKATENFRLPDRTKKERCCRRLAQHQPASFRAKVFPVCLNLSVEMRDGIALARHVNLLSALTSEIRHETSDAEIGHFVTLLNSGDPATLLLGTRHAPAKSADVP